MFLFCSCCCGFCHLCVCVWICVLLLCITWSRCPVYVESHSGGVSSCISSCHAGLRPPLCHVVSCSGVMCSCMSFMSCEVAFFMRSCLLHHVLWSCHLLHVMWSCRLVCHVELPPSSCRGVAAFPVSGVATFLMWSCRLLHVMWSYNLQCSLPCGVTFCHVFFMTYGITFSSCSAAFFSFV